MSRLNRIEIERDLIIIVVLTLVVVLLVSISSSTWLRIVFGLPFILFFPGYTLIAVLFPGKEGLGGIERMAFSFGLSIAVTPLIGLILNYTPWDIKLYPILLSMSFIILAMSAISWYRRARLPLEERFYVPFLYQQKLPALKWPEVGRWDKVLYTLLIAAVIGAIGTTAYVISTSKEGEGFTEFYILGLEGKAEQYPRELWLGDMGEVVLGFANNEHETTSYRVEVWIVKDEAEEQVNIWLDGVEREEIELELAHEEKWEREIGFIPQTAGFNQRVEFRLFKDGDSEPYLTLHLYVDVVDYIFSPIIKLVFAVTQFLL